MPAGQPWSQEELLLALGLYLDPTLGSQDKRNPLIIDLASRIGRTPDSVVSKMANFKFLDPAVEGGFSNVGQADRDLWNDILNHPVEVEAAISNAWRDEESAVTVHSQEQGTEGLMSLQQTESTALTKARRGQNLFRRAILNAYERRCCVTGISDARLLVASHIRPWRDDEENRLNPANGLCLNILHDKAFDIGLMTIDEDFRIKISSTLKQGDVRFLSTNFGSYDGQKITLPKVHQPAQKHLAYHRKHIFLS